MINKAFILMIFMASISHAADYNCLQNTPTSSQFFDKKIKIQCELDTAGKPMFMMLAGSTKVALNEKARYVGPESGNIYSEFTMIALDGQRFDVHAVTRMFTEGTIQASIFTVEPNHKGSSFWVCQLVD